MSVTVVQTSPNVNHNVYILGAGFAFDGGVPLIENFLEWTADALSYSDLRSDKKNVLLLPPTWRKTFGGNLTSVLKKAVRAFEGKHRIDRYNKGIGALALSNSL